MTKIIKVMKTTKKYQIEILEFKNTVTEIKKPSRQWVGLTDTADEN